MIRLFAAWVLAGASVNAQTITETFGSGANAFSIDFVTIGNPNNAADTTGAPNPVGRVDYIYNLGKYEISRGQIERANSAGSLGIMLEDMTSFAGSSANGANRPATTVSWNEAARFVNWLNTSKGYQAAYNFTTSGSNDNITMWGANQYSGTNRYRHKDAYYFLPSVDEWYKGAYGSPSGAWYKYANGSDSAPTAVSGGASGAVYNQAAGQGPADVTDAGDLSPYGTMAQGGNVYEWNESAFDRINDSSIEWRVYRGAGWTDSNFEYLGSSKTLFAVGTSQFYTTGFRVASVPEPSSLSLLLAGGAVLMAGRRRIS